MSEWTGFFKVGYLSQKQGRNVDVLGVKWWEVPRNKIDSFVIT